MRKHPAFAGFPPEMLKFFRGLERNNRRDWFQPRKHIFDEHVRAPMLELITALNMEIVRFAPDHVTDPPKALYRIYRDTRFSANKTPYKDHLAVTLPRRGMDRNTAAGYYFSVSHREVEVAGGLYMPGPAELLAVRTRISERYEQFRRAAAAPKLVRVMEPLKGDSLTRVPKGFSADDPAADLIKMKQWYYYTKLPAEIATTPALLDELVTRFKALQPIVDFLNAPLATTKPRLTPDELLF